MGGNYSNLLPVPLGFDYMVITFRAYDRIRMIYATDQEVRMIRDTITQHWPKGNSVFLEFRLVSSSASQVCTQAKTCPEIHGKGLCCPRMKNCPPIVTGNYSFPFAVISFIEGISHFRSSGQ